MTDKYADLRAAIAAGPTPGPRRVGTPPPNGEQTIGTQEGRMLAVVTTGIGMEEETLANANLIAAADPDTIAALLAERDALRDALAPLYPLASGLTRGLVYTAQRAGEVGAIFEAARAALAMGDTDAR